MKLTDYAKSAREQLGDLGVGFCPECGRPHKRSRRGLCPRCQMRKYVATPEGRARVREINRRNTPKWWAKKTPEEKLAYGRERRQRHLGEEPPKHGLNGYQMYGCRCEICKEAMRETKRRQRPKTKD